VKTLTSIPQHKTIAENIRKKVLKTRSGFPAPAFELRDANGIFRSSSNYLANYIYLNFISVESFTCIQDLELLKKLYEKHKTDFKIISICIDDDFKKAVDLFKEKGYNWILLSYKAQKSIINDYNIKAYPTYYLIDPNGKFAMSPAVSPSENFEWYFFKMLQAKKRRQLHEKNK
jgi:peroxiredoxin